MAWGDTQFQGRIKRVGINFGAPGDRMAESGTLWLDYPSVGGPSPDVAISVMPGNSAFYYRHSLWIKGGEGMPWVQASGIEGAERIAVGLLPKASETDDAIELLPYTVRLYFAEPNDLKPGQRVFSVSLQGQKVLKNIDVAKAAGGGMRGMVKEFKGIRVGRMLELSFTAKADVPILSGVEFLLERF